MESITTQRPRGFARACLDQVARGNRTVVETLLGRPLGNDYPRDMQELLGHISAYLAADCPFLTTLQPKESVAEYRWSDRKGGSSSAERLQFSKTPPPDNARRIWASRSEEQQFQGTVIRMEEETLGLSDGAGMEMTIIVPGRLRSGLVLRVGDPVRVRFRTDWNLKKDKVQHVLLEVL